MRPWSWYEAPAEGAARALQADPTLEAPLAIVGYMDDEYYLSSYLPDLGISVLVRTTAEGGIRRGIELPGQIATSSCVY